MNDLGFGLTITVIGMGLVFALLALLWLLLTLAGKIDRPEAEPATEEAADDVATGELAATPVIVSPVAGLSADACAAITIAVLVHTAARRRQAAPLMRTTYPGSQIYASRWMAAGRTRQTRSWIRRR